MKRRDAILGIVGTVVFGPQACVDGSTDTLIGPVAQQPIATDWATSRADIPAMIRDVNLRFFEMTGRGNVTLVTTQQGVIDLGVYKDSSSIIVMAHSDS